MDHLPVFIDLKREVSAKLGTYLDEFLYDGRWYSQPGLMIKLDGTNAYGGYMIACPGCGQVGSPKKDAHWTIIGNIEEPSTLTFNPSILKNCCGWHGYLVKGRFQMSPG